MILSCTQKIFYVVALVSITGWCNESFAQYGQETLENLSLEELSQIKVTTISRVNESIDRAPGDIYVYTRALIQKRGYRSLKELLQIVPGFTVFHRDLQFVAGIRGLNANDNEKVTLLINGEELNQLTEAEFLNGPINLDNVERVEVVVGPSSLFQPANTLAATINVITKNSEGPEVIGAIGNDLPYSATVMDGKRWSENNRANFSFTVEQRKGFDAWSSDFRPNIAGKKITGELDWPSFFSVLQLGGKEWSGQAVAYRSVHPELLIDNGDPRNKAFHVDQFYSLFVKNDHAVSDDFDRIIRTSITFKNQYRKNRDGLPINALQESNKQIVYNGELGFRYKGFQKQLIQAGVQASYDDNFDTWYTLDQRNPEIVIPQTTLVSRNTYALGFYADDIVDISEKLKLIGGMRFDKNQRLLNDKWYNGERAGIVVDPTKNWISKIFFNRAVRMPSPYSSPLNEAWGKTKANPPPFAQFSTNAERPEILSTLEFQNIFYLGNFRLGATLYHQELKDFISWLEPSTNVGNFRGNGVELSLQAPLLTHFTLWGNASYNNSKLFADVSPSPSTIEQHHVEVNPEHRIIGAPKYTANAGVDYEIHDNVHFSPALRYFTEQAAFDFTRQNFVTIHNRLYVDAAITLKNIKKIKGTEADVSLSCQNLLDNRKEVAGQWLRDTYRPMGTSIVLAMGVRW
jgi:outer membrane receptor protein involved in Fe transport